MWQYVCVFMSGMAVWAQGLKSPSRGAHFFTLQVSLLSQSFGASLVSPNASVGTFAMYPFGWCHEPGFSLEDFLGQAG